MKQKKTQNNVRRNFKTQEEIIRNDKKTGKVKIGRVISNYIVIRREYFYDIDRTKKSDEKGKIENEKYRSSSGLRIPNGEYLVKIIYSQINKKREIANEAMFVLKIIKSLDGNEKFVGRCIYYTTSLLNDTPHFDELAYEALDRYYPKIIHLNHFINKEIQIKTKDTTYNYEVELVRKKL